MGAVIILILQMRILSNGKMKSFAQVTRPGNSGASITTPKLWLQSLCSQPCCLTWGWWTHFTDEKAEVKPLARDLTAGGGGAGVRPWQASSSRCSITPVWRRAWPCRILADGCQLDQLHLNLRCFQGWGERINNNYQDLPICRHGSVVWLTSIR